MFTGFYCSVPRSWSQRPSGPFMNNIPVNDGTANYSHDQGVNNNVSSADTVHHRDHQQVFKSFMVSTRSNTAYNDINRVLNGIHVDRYGNPERREGWWKKGEEHSNIEEEMVLESDSDEGTDDIQAMEDVSFYMAANAILREAFLQRHRPENHS